MTKSELIAALQSIDGDPEIRIHQNLRLSWPISHCTFYPKGDYDDGQVKFPKDSKRHVRHPSIHLYAVTEKMLVEI